MCVPFPLIASCMVRLWCNWTVHDCKFCNNNNSKNKSNHSSSSSRKIKIIAAKIAATVMFAACGVCVCFMAKNGNKRANWVCGCVFVWFPCANCYSKNVIANWVNRVEMLHYCVRCSGVELPRCILQQPQDRKKTYRISTGTVQTGNSHCFMKSHDCGICLTFLC